MGKAVFGAPEFKARSGRMVKVGEDGSLSIDHKRGYLSPEVVMDVEEWAQAQRDIELGRWRWPENPDYVVYVDGGRVAVVDERNGDRTHYLRSLCASTPAPIAPDGHHAAAHAYYEAHPERKLPEENGVYVPASVDLANGPLTFVLYSGSWRSTPGSDDAAELARKLHTRVGLVRLGKTEVAL